jgi:hypothetical protein
MERCPRPYLRKKVVLGCIPSPMPRVEKIRRFAHRESLAPRCCGCLHEYRAVDETCKFRTRRVRAVEYDNGCRVAPNRVGRNRVKKSSVGTTVAGKTAASCDAMVDFPAPLRPSIATTRGAPRASSMCSRCRRSASITESPLTFALHEARAILSTASRPDRAQRSRARGPPGTARRRWWRVPRATPWPRDAGHP